MTIIQPTTAQLPQMQAMSQQPVYITSLAQLPPGAVPLSQGMMAQAMGVTGAQAVQPPNRIGTIVGTVLKHAAIGAGVGAAIGLIPGLPPTMFTGAVLGAGTGALLGVFRGLKKAKEQEQQFVALQSQQAQTAAMSPQTAAQQPGVAQPVAAPGPYPVGAQVPGAPLSPSGEIGTVGPAAPPIDAKFPGAKTFTDGAGNVRQVGSGKILKAAAK